MSWFKMHRQIFENGIWKNPIEFRLFTWLIGNAVYDKDIHYSEVTIKRGQFLRISKQAKRLTTLFGL